MRRWCMVSVAVCTLGLAAGSSRMLAQTAPVSGHQDVVFDGREPRRGTPGDSAPAVSPKGISITPDNQILVELAPEDTSDANPFDLNGRTLVFTPDGPGRYSRSVRALAWEDDIGPAVADGQEIEFRSFTFDFADRSWSSFFVSRFGLITFGVPLRYSYEDPGNRFDTMSAIAGKLVADPTISPLYKPRLGGLRGSTDGVTQHVARRPEAVVITWITTEPAFWVHGVRPEKPLRFQTVLHADGRIAFSYADVTLGDGIVGLFPHDEVAKGDLVASVVDGADPDRPGHIDLLDASIYASNGDAVILEFTLREAVPDPPAGSRYSYRLHVDTDEPYWSHPVDWSDEDFTWQVDLRPGGERAARGRGVIRLLPSASPNQIALLARVGGDNGTSGAAFAAAVEFDDDSGAQADGSGMTAVELSAGGASLADLSRPDDGFTAEHAEVFHYRRRPDTQRISCRVVEALGDEFDLFVFHTEFRVDSQEAGSPWSMYAGNVGVTGIGGWTDGAPPCGEGRLKGHWTVPVWMSSRDVLGEARRHDERFDSGLLLFAHEFTHSWTAYASYDRNGEREPLHVSPAEYHWRADLHLPAAFPWHPNDPGPVSLMGGRHWRDNLDGTFTPLNGYWAGGHSWLDLYMMGLAEADEVPDMFILRNLRPVTEGDSRGPHTGEKEVVSIEQVIAAEGRRRPPAVRAQKDFNAGFIYLLEPGRKATSGMLRLHAEYRDKVIEHWHHVTGRRSRMTTVVPSVANRSPVPVGQLPDLVGLHVGRPEAVDVAGAFRDPDGHLLTYTAVSSAPGVATVTVSSSGLTVTPVGPGSAAMTVTATDDGGLSARQRFAVTVAARPTFTDHPIVPGTTPIRAIHFTELRNRIDAARRRGGLPAFRWTDAALVAGVTPVRRIHLMELRSALDAVYDAAGRTRPAYGDTRAEAAATPIRAAHIMELRAAVLRAE